MPQDTIGYTGHLADLFVRVATGALTEEILRGVAGEEITPALLTVLECLRRRGTCPVGDVARALGVSYAAGSQFVRRLEEKGLLLRGEDASDRRRSPLRLTSKGEQLVDAIERARAARWEEVLGRMDAGDRRALVQGLEAFLFHIIEDRQTIEQLCGRCRILHLPDCVVNRAAVAVTGQDAVSSEGA